MTDDVIEALADRHRRQLLGRLTEQPQLPFGTGELAEAIQEGESEVDTLQTRMYHVHLPKLEDAALVDWDRENDAITRGERFEEYRTLPDVVDSTVASTTN